MHEEFKKLVEALQEAGWERSDYLDSIRFTAYDESTQRPIRIIQLQRYNNEWAYTQIREETTEGSGVVALRETMLQRG